MTHSFARSTDLADLPDLKRLAELEAFMRANGITHLKLDGVELNLGPKPAPPKAEEDEATLGKRIERAKKKAEALADFAHRTMFAHSRVRPRRVDRTLRSDDKT